MLKGEAKRDYQRRYMKGYMRGRRAFGCANRELENSARWKKEHPEAVKARNKLLNAIRYGKTVKPDHCVLCHCKANVSGHHEDYAKPLEVLWLCPSCHKKIHRPPSVKTPDKSISHKDFRAELLSDPDVRREYDKLDADGNLIPDYD